MRPRHRLNRLLETLAIPNITLYLVLTQAIVLVGLYAGAISPASLTLVPALVLAGEWWRIFSFMFEPVTVSLFFVLFAWLFLYFLGSGLEQHWGVVRFNLYLFTGWILTVAVSFLTPYAQTTNAFIIGSITLAFAWIAPDFEILLFVVPVRIKWVALFYLALDLYYCVVMGWNVRLAFLASIVPFFLFFGRDIVGRLRGQQRRAAYERRTRVEAPVGPRHTCVICGKNSDTHPDLDFRYCSKCAGEQCYCPDHIRNHEHVTEEAPRQP